MKTEDNDKTQFTAAAIARYLQGEMTPAEMHAIEKAALDDPFLADALDGYNDMSPTSQTVADDLEDLKKRLKNRLEPAEEKRVIGTGWWRIAALVLILAGTGSIIYKIVNTSGLHEKTVITKNETDVQDVLQDSMAANKMDENKVTTVDSTAVALNDRADKPVPQASPVDKNLALYKSKKAPSPSEIPALMAPIPAEQKAAQLRPDSGKDVAELANVPKSTESQAVAENKKFSKAMPVTGMDTRQKKEEEQDALTEPANAAPAIGFVEYKKYIEKNKYSGFIENNIHGDVAVSFYVNKNGRLSNFTIEKPLSEAMDKKAISLIEQGPSWKSLSDKKVKVQYTIRF